jgi:hypothetical protein
VAPAAGPAPGFPLAAVAASIAVLGGMDVLWRRILAREALDPASGVRLTA